ncbi:MAG: thioredoxin [Candidatus Thorarchaeota archaeon]
MSDRELEQIRLKKMQELLKRQPMPKEIVKIHNIKEFEKLNKDFDKIIIVDFWAIWCAPCMAFAPVFERLQQEYGKEFIFTKVNVDENPEISRKYGITGIPTTLFLKKEKVLSKIVGAMNYDKMKLIIEQMKDFNH